MGGTVWAKAEHVSRDAKRIYGSLVSKTWLKGVVTKVSSITREGGRRATTIIEAKYKCGDEEKVKSLSLQVLKDKDPNSVVANSSTNGSTAGATNNDAPPTANNNNTASPTAAAVDEAPSESPTEVEDTTDALCEASGEPPDSSSPESTSTDASGPSPASVNHGREWFEGPTEVDINGPVPMKFWKMTDQYSGREYTPGCDDRKKKQFTPYDYFMAVFPREQLKAMVDLTNANLRVHNCKPTTVGEVLKWLGINVLITRFEFGDRASLWETKPRSKYIPAVALGEKTGMSRDRFNELLRFMQWSFQPGERPDEMSSEEYRWSLVQDFIDRFNEHRKKFMTPGQRIVADESISRCTMQRNFYSFGFCKAKKTRFVQKLATRAL